MASTGQKPSGDGSPDYEAGLSTTVREGEVKVGLSVEKPELADLVVGVSLVAPRVGELSLGILVEESGAARVGWLARTDPAGQPAPPVPTVEAELRKQVQDAEALGARERSRAVAAEEALAAMRKAAQVERELSQQRLMAAQEGAEAAASRIAALEADIETLREKEFEGREAAQDLDRARSRIEEVETRVSQVESELQRTRESGRSIADELEKRRAELKRAQEATAAAQRLAAERAVSVTRLEGELKAQAEMASALQSRLEQETTSREAEIARLQAASKAADDRIRGLEQSIREKELALTRVRNELTAVQASRARAEDLAKAQKGEISRLRDELAEASRQLAERDEALSARGATIGKLESEVAEGRRKMAEMETAATQAAARLADLDARLQNTTRERDETLAKASALGKELEAEQSVSTSRLAGIEEEHKRQAELLGDIAFIRSQVADLSTSKEALLARLETMAQREEQRKGAAAAMVLRLRDAEVLAADRTTAMRKLQARIQQLEAKVAADASRAGDLLRQVAVVKELQVRVQSLTAERDALKTNLLFLQRQVAAFNRPRGSAPKAPPAEEESQPRPTEEEITAIGLELPNEWSGVPTEPVPMLDSPIPADPKVPPKR